ncbi:glucoamylase family protein [Opitutus terrae]|uniref:glucoamylase family protein n=1 Tax=Opitutus terrae TaxID=107709 RepID=UPI0002DE6C8F|nr:glucoamylase family protein [Opitutus terrae]
MAAILIATGVLELAAQPLRHPNLSGARPGAILSEDDHALLDDIQRASFLYFVEQTHPETGLVRDRARADGSPSEGKASIAASGFALSSWALAAHRGWVERDEALERVRLMLRFLANQAPRRHGFFYHFMEMETGARAWQCEISSIDTGLFLAGAIIAREYFQDPEITDLVNRLYRDVDWRWFLNGGDTVSMGWHDETGFSRYRWRIYSEHMMMSFLAMGAPANALEPSYWHAWKRLPAGTYAGYHFMQGPPLFIHQFAHAYVDFRDRRDAFVDYYQNSVLATLAQRRFCMDLRTEFSSWGERLWGITASDSATGYKAWGGPPRTTAYNALDGTIVPCAAAGSVPFAPYETMMVLRHIRTVYGDRVWKRYGFVDAFNPETGWVNPDVIGIDQGITILQAENARTGFFWSLFMRAPEVQRALSRSGFVSKRRAFTWPEREQLRELAATAWQSLANEPVTPDTLGLRITAVPAAQALGLVDGASAHRQLRELLSAAAPPATDTAVAEYAASLLTLRQAVPSLAADATRLLEAINWEQVTISSTKLGSASRLATFLKIGAGKSDPSAWDRLVRTPEVRGMVFVLSPGTVADQLRPSLWLDESSIITGASGAQLAYSAAVVPPPANGNPRPTPDLLTTALLLDNYPAELLARIKDAPPAPAWITSAAPADRAILLATVANVLVPEIVRDWFQADALVRATRANITDFTQASFGQNTSLYWRYELAGPFVEPAERRAVAVPASTPREAWQWTRIAGLEFKDSPADVRPDDPLLELRFAFTWDNEALHFHAEAIDTPAPNPPAPEREEIVELLIDPKGDGLVWRGPEDFHFVFRGSGEAIEWNHNRAPEARIERTPQGYTVEADIPWSLLGLTPQPGLELNLTTAVARNGRYEWEPSLKLNWRFFQRRDERYGLGKVKLQ